LFIIEPGEFECFCISAPAGTPHRAFEIFVREIGQCYVAFRPIKQARQLSWRMRPD